MSSCKDSCGYKDYINNDAPLVKKSSRLIASVAQNEIEDFKELLDAPEWYKVVDKNGHSLLQIAMFLDRVEIFHHLLSLDDFPLEMVDSDGYTALESSLCGFVWYGFSISEYFAIQLIDKGADVNGSGYDNNSLLHLAMQQNFMEVARLLVEKGIDLNRQNDDWNTPLHMCFSCCNLVEGVTMLLCYGADPSIRNRQNLTPFDMAVLDIPWDCSVSVVAHHLFYCTFDQHTQYKISADVLVSLAISESPLFYKVIDYIVEVFFIDSVDIRCLNIFLMKPEYLQLLIQKFRYVVQEILTNYADLVSFECATERFAENFYILIQSNLNQEVVSFICSFNKNEFMINVLFSKVSEKVITEFVCTLLSYGMIIQETVLLYVYHRFGYCELFKILLHMDLESEQLNSYANYVMPRLIYDVKTNIQDVIDNCKICSLKDLKELVHHCAHPKLRQCCQDKIPRDAYLVKQLKNLPPVPLLVELARNMFRRYFIQRCKITSSKQFYTLLKSLPICATHERIISFETKLY